MYNITLVCTHHSEIGKCNSDELYKIIESIKPDIIFEELCQDLFDKFYKENTIPFETPEIKTVKRYIQHRSLEHVPVDHKVNETLSTTEIYYVFNILEKSAVFSALETNQITLISQEGYAFLNSKKNEDLIEKKKSLGRGLLQFQPNRNQLLKIHELFWEEAQNREHEIIKNIYNYSKKAVYNQAVLLIGSGHRRTIFEKIKKYQSDSDVKLNWELYGN